MDDTKSILRITTLGGFEVVLANQSLNTFESDKSRALFVYLAVEANRSHRREHLASLLWPEKPIFNARHSLSQALYSLRSILEQKEGWTPFEVSVQTIQFQRGSSVWVDTVEFTQLTNAYDQHKHTGDWVCQDCQAKLEKAVSLYQGDFLAGLSLNGCQEFEEWVYLKRESLHQKAIQALNRLVMTLSQHQNPEKALEYALRRIALDPLDEAGHRQIMQLYARLGRKTEALAQYTDCQKILASELDVKPAPETTNLYLEIANQFEQTPASKPVRNLPTPLTRLTGRQIELDSICQKISGPDCRLLTILGPGGIGKTRLAIEAGHRLLSNFPDGVYLTELITQSANQNLQSLIIQSIGLEQYSEIDALRRQETGSRMKQLVEHLRDKNLLLILDGFEGILEQAELAAHLLRQAPALKILVTSRARLNLKSEQIFPIEGLPYPQDISSASDPNSFGSILLFEDAARRAKPDFKLTPQNIPAVYQICRLNQGMPLGILLAAAWVNTLAPNQIVPEIARSFDFLTADWRDLPERQRSLRGTFDHSWRLLNNTEQITFLRLSVFQGAFSANRAAQVTQASFQSLKFLIDQSLLQPDGENRYRMHDLLRQYAQEKLATLPDENLFVHERFCQVFMEALTTWEPRLKSRDQFEALVEMDGEQADFRAAWDWAVRRNRIEALKDSSDGLGYYYVLRQQPELGSSAFETAVNQVAKDGITDDNLLAWAILASWKAYFDMMVKGREESMQLYEEIDCRLQAAGTRTSSIRKVHAGVLLSMGRLLVSRSQWLLLEEAGDNLLQQALSLIEQSLAELRVCGSDWDIVSALEAAAECHNYLGNIFENQHFSVEAIKMDVGDPSVTVRIETNLGYVYMLTGEYDKAMQIVEKQNTYRQKIGSRAANAMENLMTGIALYYMGEYDAARAALKECIRLFSMSENMPGIRFARYLIYIMDLYTGDYEAVRQEKAWNGFIIDASWSPLNALIKGQLCLIENDLEQAEARFVEYHDFVKTIQRMDMPGLALAQMVFTAYRRHNLEDARIYMIQALENGLQQGFFWVFNLALSVLSVILAENEELEQAAELYATATTHPMAANALFFHDLFGKRIAALTNALPPETLHAAQMRGHGRNLYEVGQTYLEKLKNEKNLMDALAGKI